MKEREVPSLVATSIFATLLTLMVSLVSFANQLLIAKLFGVSKELTAYQIATSAPTAVSGVFVASLLYSMVPLLVRARLEGEAADRFQGAVFLRTMGLALAVAAIGLAISGPLIDYLSRSLDEPTRGIARTVGYLSWATVAPTVLLAQLSAMHDAAQRFLTTVLGSSGPYVGMVVGGLLFGHRLGVLAIAAGMMAGTLTSIVVLGFLARHDTDFRPPTQEQRTTIAFFFRQMPLIALSVMIFISFGFIDAYWAPQVGPHSLPSLGYGQRLLVAFGTLVTSGPSAIIVPRLAKAAAEGRDADFRDDAARAIRTVVAFGGFVAGAISILAYPLVALLFERGQFGPDATERVAGVMPWMMGGMVSMLGVGILFRSFYARNWIRPTAILAVGTVGGYFILSGVLSRPFGTEGIAAAYAIVWTGALIVGLPLQWREHRAELVSRPNLRYASHLFLSLAGSLAAMAILERFLLPSHDALSKAQMAIRLAVCGFTGLGLFYLLSVRLFRMADTELIFGFFGRLARKLVRRGAA